MAIGKHSLCDHIAIAIRPLTKMTRLLLLLVPEFASRPLRYLCVLCGLGPEDQEKTAKVSKPDAESRRGMHLVESNRIRAVVLCALVIPVLGGCDLMTHTRCDDTILVEEKSPDGEYVAILYRRSCANNTGLVHVRHLKGDLK